MTQTLNKYYDLDKLLSKDRIYTIIIKERSYGKHLADYEYETKRHSDKIEQIGDYDDSDIE